MTAHWRQQVVNFCFPGGPLKIWCKPFCIFLSTFTVVMFLLVMSVDLRRKRYLPLDAVIWDFEGTPQESPVIVDIIKANYIDPPGNFTFHNESSSIPSRQLMKVLHNKKNGIAIECGATSDHTDTDWLIGKLGWRVLKIQPNPLEIERLRVRNLGAHTSHSCVAAENLTSHTHIQTTLNFPNGTLTAVPCFPLYSMMKAFSASVLDLLIFNDVKFPTKILQTLPAHLLAIRVISFVNHPARSNAEARDICCAEKTKRLMRGWGYSSSSSCPSQSESCYYACDGPFCPNILGKQR